MEEKEQEKNIGSLNSSVEEKGKIVTQIIVFSNGNRKTFKHVRTETLSQSEFTHFDLIDGRRIYINTKNVDFFEVFAEKFDEKELKEESKKKKEEVQERREENKEERKFNY